jgi:signal recognition particle subunit SRP54
VFKGIKSAISCFFDKEDSVYYNDEIKNLIASLKTDLINSDISVNFADNITQNISNSIKHFDKNTPNIKEKIFILLKNKIQDVLGGNFEGIKLEKDKMTVIMVCGPQGAGKTAFCVKLCNKIKQSKKHIRIATCSVDIKRPAAQQQLKNIAKKAGIDHIEIGDGTYNFSTTTSCAAYLYSIAYKSGYAVLVVDTQGVSVTNAVEIKRLRCVKEIIKPDETLLVLDTTMGQVSANIATKFDQLIGIDGIVLTKVDSDSNGGVAINVRSAINKPIKYLSIGEKIENIEEFHPSRIANRMLNIGDNEGMKDYIKNSFSTKSQISLADKISGGTFDFNDLYDQLIDIKKTGGISSIFNFLPTKANDNRIKKEALIKQQIAIILSMTKQERKNPSLIIKSRRERIAIGSGNSLASVIETINRLVRLRKVLNC